MSDLNKELERKYNAEKVVIKEFLQWAMTLGPYEYILIEDAIDDYYVNSEGYTQRVRHKGPGGQIQLSVKLRTSSRSIINRYEYDLHVSDSTDIVKNYIEGCGFKHTFSIIKTAHIFSFNNTKYPIDLVIYTVSKLDQQLVKTKEEMKIIEVEIKKGSNVPEEDGLRYLKTWNDRIKSIFDVDILTQSLYEIYSNSSYKIKEESNG